MKTQTENQPVTLVPADTKPVFCVNSLPVPAEFTGTFVEILYEQVHQQVWDTLQECFDVLKVPEGVRSLVSNLEALTYHYQLPNKSPEDFTEMMDVIMDAADNVMAVGGTFQGKRRKGTLLGKAKKDGKSE